MTARRIRCECGRVYEPAKSPKCPSCGAEAAVAVTEPRKPREPEPLVRHERGARDVSSDEDAKPIAISGRTIIGSALIALILLIVYLKRPPPPPPIVNNVSPSPIATASAAPTASAIITPPPNTTPPPPGYFAPQQFDLPAAIASAAPGATIKVPPGFYQGGLMLTKPVHLVSSGGQSWIQSDGRECLNVKSPGVSVQGLQFTCNGIGELAAISVVEGAELELDGCRIQSSTGVGVSLVGAATLKATGVNLTVSNGIALRMQGGKANLTQSTFADSKYALNAANGATLELQSCAFERMDMNGDGGILVLSGQGTTLRATDCQFTGNSGAIWATDGATFSAASSTFKENGTNMNPAAMNGLIALRKNGRAIIDRASFEGNRQGISVGDGSMLELVQSSLLENGLQQTRQIVIPSFPLSIYGQNSSASVRNTIFGDSKQYAVVVVQGATLTLNEVEIYGSRNGAVIVGDRSGQAVHAEIRRARLHNNENALGIFAGSSVVLEDSEARENNEGITVSDNGSHLEMRKGGCFGNRDHGLLVVAEASATATASEFRNNARGAQSGLPKKNMGRGSLTLDGCTLGGNKVFGAGAHSQSELTLLHCNFDGTDKVPVYKERNAIVQNEAPESPSPSPNPSSAPSEETSPTPNESPSASATATPSSTPKARARATARPRRREDDASRILRHIFGPR
ncbi:MAG: right-handed parallel beta-helix repeat-containing protein [Verrucomicrobiota bacterium]|nr:right-handed parallel beta-helix repeat-containing protein [Verrucomicrobiota bacterium]